MWWRLSLATTVFVLDQLTKLLAVQYLTYQAGIKVTPFFNLVMVHNAGAAFGFLSSASGWQNTLFIVIAAFACVFILWMTWHIDVKEKMLATGLMLILGGAAGNLLDRLLHGYVIDFVDLYYQTWHWPVFNIADSAITLGAALLILDSLGFWKQRAR